MRRLATAENRYPDASGRPAAERVHHALARRAGSPAPNLTRQTSRQTLAAVEVNHGRWIVRCPLVDPQTGERCGGCQLASLTDARVLCVQCGNHQVGGRWVRVVWPDDPETIERVLLARPRLSTLNWHPEQSATELMLENAAHGVRLGL